MDEKFWSPYIGWGLFVAVVTVVAVVTACLKMKRGAAAKAWYFICILGAPVIGLVAAIIAATLEKNTFTAYGATMIAAGTVIQILLDTSKRAKPVPSNSEKSEKDANLAPSDDTDRLKSRESAWVISNEETRDTLRASGWSIIFVGAIATVAAAFV